MAVVACKSCGKELGKGVKKCIHCGADQRNFFAKHKIITGLAVLLLLGVVTSALNGGDGSDKTADSGAKAASSSDKTATSSEEPAAEAPSEQKIGQTFDSGNVQVTVVSAELKDKVGGEYFESKPAEGGVYVAVVWKYKNIGNEPIGMFSQPSLKLIDPNGVEYDSDAGASASYSTERELTEKVISDLNPGITVTAAEVFEVAKDSYDPKTWKVLVKADDDMRVGIQ